LVLFFKKEHLLLLAYLSFVPFGMAHIFLATPCYGGQVTLPYFHSVISLMMHGVAQGLPVTVETLAGESLIPRGRNSLVAKFLAHPVATHLLFVDADIGFSPEAVRRLLALGEDVVAGVYPLKQFFWDEAAVARAKGGELITTAALRYVGKACEGGARRGDFVAAEYAGTGFMLISRAALERMIAAYPELHYDMAHVPNAAPPEFLFALFDTAIDAASGHYLSEDYTFCARWRALGGTIWLDTASALTHTGTHEYVGAPAGRFAPAFADAA
jgi:hypothetical protein